MIHPCLWNGTGEIWLRTGQLACSYEHSNDPHGSKILGIYWLAERLLRSQEVRCSVELEGLIYLLIYSLNK